MTLNGHIIPQYMQGITNGGNSAGNTAATPVAGSNQPAYNIEQPRVARRTFGLFCLCDFLLIFLLWTILLSIKKKDSTFIHMFSNEIKTYSISTSMADVVLLSLVRDSVLAMCYLVLKCKHWAGAGFCAVCSSAFLLSKVFLYPMSSTGQPVTYFSILASFAMTWIATYMVDFKKLRNNQEFGSSNAVQPSVFFPTGGQVAPDYHHSLGTNRVQRSGVAGSGGGFDVDSASVYVTVNGSEVGEENRRVLPLLEEDSELSAIEKTAEIDSREAFEIGIRLRDLPGEEWKLEECGAYGTCVCMRQMPELGRVYKLEMVINLSPEQLQRELTDYPNIPSWDKTLDSISLLHSFGEFTKVLRIVSNEIEGRRSIAKREFIVSMRSSTIDSTFYSFGSSISYSPDEIANNSTNERQSSDATYNKHDQDNQLDEMSASLTRGDYKILGYIIKSIDTDCNKCELIRFMATDIKSWIAQFRVDKAITQLLLTYADCLQSRAKILNQEAPTTPNKVKDAKPANTHSIVSSEPSNITDQNASSA